MKLADLKQRLSVKQRQTLATTAVLGGIMLIIIIGLYISDPSHKHKVDTRSAEQKAAHDVSKDYRTPSQNIDPAEVWMARSEARLREMEKSNEEFSRQLGEMKGEFEKGQHAGPSSIPPLPGETASGPTPFPNSSPAFPKTPLPPPPGADTQHTVVPAVPAAAPAQTGPRITDVSLAGGTEPKDSKPAEPVPTIRDSIPAGAFTSAVMLNGLDAPTGGLAKTSPIPVEMLLLNNGTLPNHFHSRVKHCFVIGAGYGDLSAERAYIRLEKLSCVMRDGKVLDADVEGYIAGEDGKVGLRGIVISKQGQMIARALVAGLASGMGQSLSQSYSSVSTSPLGSVQTVNPSEVAQAGVASGVGKALDKIADFYIARANEMYPVVEVDSSRRGDVILNKRVSLGPEFAQAWADDE
ncbi:MAG: TraB/VirB10 family protein [Nevskia sp.]|nr:TraB/VirB10 family protein [Nevskia sp.]